MKFIESLINLQEDFKKIQWLGKCKINILNGSFGDSISTVNAILFKINYFDWVFAVHKQINSKGHYNVTIVKAGLAAGRIGAWSIEEAILLLLFDLKKRKVKGFLEAYDKNEVVIKTKHTFVLHTETKYLLEYHQTQNFTNDIDVYKPIEIVKLPKNGRIVSYTCKDFILPKFK